MIIVLSVFNGGQTHSVGCPHIGFEAVKEIRVLFCTTAIFEVVVCESVNECPPDGSMATWGNHEQSHVGQNYLRSLFALGFQGFLILICVAIYAVLLQNVAISGDAINSIWSIVGYTVLLCFTLFKTGSVARSILGAH